ncbi:hypothetical protein L1887_18001 [Cichorium endivia]|nr:hypothetical protein L1887_18001 [Cichorium endivia]
MERRTKKLKLVCSVAIERLYRFNSRLRAFTNLFWRTRLKIVATSRSDSCKESLSAIQDGDSSYKKNQRKKKLSDMLGPHWSKDELEHFYEAYCKHGRDWRKVAAVLRNRSVEMVESVYSLNKAYLSLPKGTASVAGFIAMMTDYYSNMKIEIVNKKRMMVWEHLGSLKNVCKAKFMRPYLKVLLTFKFASRGSFVRLWFHVIIKKETLWWKQTPCCVKLRADNDEDVAHSIAMALAEASKRGSSPNKRDLPDASTSAGRLVVYDGDRSSFSEGL